MTVPGGSESRRGGEARGVGEPKAGTGRPSGASPFERLVCVAPNAAIDKIVAVNRLVPGEIHRPEIVSALPGGKGLNVARAAHLLGLPATVVAILAGRSGEWIAEALRDAGIAFRPVTVTGESRTCLSVLDRSNGSLTEFYEPGVTVDPHAWAAFEAALRAELEGESRPAAVVMSGSLPPGSPVDGYARLIRIASECGAAAALDAGSELLRAALPSHPWLVKVNAAEAASALGDSAGDELAPEAAALALHRQGAAIAVVTSGTAGAAIASDAGSWRIGPSPERGSFPVGSGDAFLAGLLAALAEGVSLPDAGRRAAAIATAHALVPGQGIFHKEDAERLLPAIAITRLV